ncbi:MAG TPA: gamma-glutamyl-gamma-aminobutyrate hydrolase family protein [Candidatus Limnocylindrales bacterium]|nr:gamma-glutamyl-gamma-aminobutyrate hydrolase family protein [Candidatus Limnocylindrales bacterium]
MSSRPDPPGLARAGGSTPRVLVTVEVASRATDPDTARQKQERYFEALRGAGADPVPIDEASDPSEREEAFSGMDGLLLSGGLDLDPQLYGAERAPETRVDPGRDALELAAWQVARQRGIPVLGICRGFQAVNVFSGGRLVQHLEGHRHGERPREPVIHPLRLRPGSRLARILRPSDPVSAVLRVNSFHHQGVRPEDVAPDLVVAGTSPGSLGDLVEAVESARADEFVVGVQCHPERTESTPPEFQRLWSVFVDACRGSALGTRVG